MSTAVKKKFAGRQSPRYRFADDDKRLIRFRSNALGRIIQTRLYDFSVSGIAFLVAEKLAPRVGETIKLDFAPMGSMRIACTARVVRIEAPSKTSDWSKFPDTVKVGISYHDLHEAYRQMLVDCLNEALRTDATPVDEGYKLRKEFRDLPLPPELSLDEKLGQWFAENGWSFLLALTLTVAAVVGCYIIVNDSNLSKTQANSQWASGFFEKIIPPTKPSR